MKRTLVLAATLIAAMPSLATAQSQVAAPAGSISTARAIVARLQLERTLNPLFAQLMPLMVANVENAIQSAPDTPAPLKARLKTDDGRKQVGAIIAEEFTAAFRLKYADIGDALAEQYRQSFSEAELKALLAFYDSPAGAKLLLLQPQFQKTLSEQGRALGRDAGMAAVPKIQARLTALGAPAAK